LTHQTGSSSWELLKRAADDWLYCVADGDAVPLVVDLKLNSALSRQSLIGGMLTIVGIAAAMIAIRRHAIASDITFRWPHATTFLLGVGYWAWLEPSWIGLVIAAASVWLALRAAWPGRALPAEGSTVLRAPHLS
jgi:hypothetical protein